MTMNGVFRWLFAGVLLSPIAPLWACPFCPGDSSGDNPVRRLIFDQQFGFHLGAVVLPFLLIGAAVPILSAYSYLAGHKSPCLTNSGDAL